jgi:hypothetical protein
MKLLLENWIEYKENLLYFVNKWKYAYYYILYKKNK